MSSPNYEIRAILSYLIVRRRLKFHVDFKNGYTKWIDVAALVELKPEWIWKDFMRGVYVYHNLRRSRFYNQLKSCLRANKFKTIITEDIIKGVKEFLEERKKEKARSKSARRRLREQGLA
jgi:hypothetical protein